MAGSNGDTSYLTRPRLRSPRTAAMAGIVFSALMGTIIGLLEISFPASSTDISGDWLNQHGDTASLAIGLVPFAGIAFLWFMGVARDLLGHLEDQFFSTVFTGSGLLFLGMVFIWAAIGATIVYGYSVNPELLIEGGFYMMGRGLMRNIIAIFAMRMAGVYVFSSGAVWFRTNVVPRWLVFLTWGAGAALWIGAILPWWDQLIFLVFPAWVFLVSAYILRENLRDQPVDRADKGANNA